MNRQESWRMFAHFAKPAVVSILCVSVFAAGCATSTRITTVPEGAKVTLNNRYLGESPVILESRSGFMETHHLKIEKAGYKTQTIPIRKQYRADESLVLLLFAIIPYFFSARFEDQETITLQKD